LSYPESLWYTYNKCLYSDYFVLVLVLPLRSSTGPAWLVIHVWIYIKLYSNLTLPLACGENNIHLNYFSFHLNTHQNSCTVDLSISLTMGKMTAV